MANDSDGKSAQSQRFKCPGCSAEMTWDAAAQCLKCSFCGQTRAVADPAAAIAEHDLFAGLAAAPRGLGSGGGVMTSRCQECGAQVAFANGTTTTRCTFCGSSRVLDQAENSAALRPESLLPFAVDKKRAAAVFAAWLDRLWFRPDDLQQLARVDEVNGVYVPFWTFDADVESRWTADAGYYYYETEEYTAEENGQRVNKTRKVQRTRWESAWGRRADHFDDLLVCASKGLPGELAARLSTFNTHQLVPYSPGFLAGWRAEEYAIDLQGGFGTAQTRMADAQRERCRHDVPGDTQRNLQVSNGFSNVTFKHVLLPVWIAAYRYRNGVYRFLVNGQTGEVVGKAPWSWRKIALFVLSLIAVAALLWLLFGRAPAPPPT